MNFQARGLQLEPENRPQDLYQLDQLQLRREYQLSSVSGLATATTPASSTTLTLDHAAYAGNFLLASSTDVEGRQVTTDRSNIGAQVCIYSGLGDRMQVDKPGGPRHVCGDS